MRKIYLFVHNEGVEARDNLVKILDSIPEVITWRYDMACCFYIISESTAEILANAIHAQWAQSRFLVTEVGTNYYGWLTDETWYLFKNKTHKPK